MANDTTNQTDNSKDKAKTFRTWVELSYRDMSKIKRSLNLPVRNSKRGQENNSKAVEDFITKTLKGEMTNTADRIAEVKDEFVKALLGAWAVDLKEEDTRGMARMLVLRAYRERDRAEQALKEALNGHASSN